MIFIVMVAAFSIRILGSNNVLPSIAASVFLHFRELESCTLQLRRCEHMYTARLKPLQIFLSFKETSWQLAKLFHDLEDCSHIIPFGLYNASVRHGQGRK